MDRTQLFDTLSNLPPAAFEGLLFAVKPPGGLIPGDTSPQMNRVKALLDWAEGFSGRGIEEILVYLNQLHQGMLPTQGKDLPNFQPYLQSILENEDYIEWQEVYTPTTVEDRRRVPVQDATTVSQRRFSSRLKLRVETVKPDQQEQGNQPDRAPKPQEQVEQWDVLAGLRNYAAEHVVLIGKPGSGKSTSLERLLWEEAEKALHDPTARIPVLVKLRRCTGAIEGLIRDFLLGHQVALEISQIEELLRQGKFLLLLDGLNELPKACETEVANFRDRYRRTTAMIVSTRDLGVGGTLGIEKKLKMLPLTEPQMREFVRGYLAEEGDRLFQQLSDDRLQKFAETPLLLFMLCWVFNKNGHVPSNLGLAFRVFTQLHEKQIQEDVPAESKGQWPKLLRHLAFALMHNKELVEFRLSMSREEAENLFTDFLLKEGRTNARGNAERCLQDLLDYHLIQPVIRPNFEEHIEFRHQLIQEYYAAEHLLRLLPDLLKDEGKFKHDYLNLLKWTEVVAMMLSLLNQEKEAFRIVKMSMEVDCHLARSLSIKLPADMRKRMAESIMQFQLPSLLKIFLIFSEEDIGCAYLIFELLNNLLQEQPLLFIEIGFEIATEVLHDDEKIFQLIIAALDNENTFIHRKAIDFLSKHGFKLKGIDQILIMSKLVLFLEDQDPDVRGNAIEVIIGYINKANIRYVNVIVNHGISNFTGRILSCDKKRQKTSKETIEFYIFIAIAKIINIAINDTELHVRETAFSKLKYVGCESEDAFAMIKAVESLNLDGIQKIDLVLSNFYASTGRPRLSILTETEDFYNSVDEASLMGDKESKFLDLILKAKKRAIKGLILRLNDKNPNIRMDAVRELEESGKVDFIDFILDRLNDEDVEVRKQAVYALRRIGGKEASFELEKLLKKSDSYLCRHAAYALGELDGKDLIMRVAQSIKDENIYTCERFFNELSIDISERMVGGFLKSIDHPNPNISKLAIQSLESIGGDGLVVELLKALDHRDYDIRERARYILDNISGIGVLPGLLCALDYQQEDVRKNAAIALGRRGSNQAIPGLINALKDPSLKVRYSAAIALSELGSEQAIPGLIDALKDPSLNVLCSADIALGRLGAKAIPGLIDALKNPSPEVRSSAISALSKLGSERAIPGLIDALIDALKNPSPEVRSSAISALSKLGSERAIPGLIDALKDPSPKVRSSAISALSNLGAPATISSMWKLFLIGNLEAVEAISTIQNRCQFYNYEMAEGIFPIGETISLYFSYAPADAPIQTQLSNHLTLLERQGVITSWSSRQILPGDDRTQTIHQQLNTADIILLLISPDAIADDTCYHLEIQRAIERHQSGEARVIPILLRPVDWQSAPFSQLDMLPKNHQPVTTWPNQDEAFQGIAAGIREIALELRRNAPTAGYPAQRDP